MVIKTIFFPIRYSRMNRILWSWYCVSGSSKDCKHAIGISLMSLYVSRIWESRQTLRCHRPLPPICPLASTSTRYACLPWHSSLYRSTTKPFATPATTDCECKAKEKNNNKHQEIHGTKIRRGINGTFAQWRLNPKT